MKKYQAVIAKLQVYIDGATTNEKLPSERVLSESFGVSRMTIRRAVDVLVRQHKVYRVPFVGLFTAGQKLRKPLDVLTGFTSEVEASGNRVHNEVIEYGVCDADQGVANKLSIEVGSKVTKVVRLRKRNQVPLIIDESYFPQAVVPLSEAVVKESIYAYIQATLKLTMQHAVQRFKAQFAPDRYCPYLEVDGATPLMFVEMIGYLDDGRVFEYTKSYKNTEAYDLILTSYKEK